MEGLKLSVIICTHNPNLGYLNEVLSALRNQSQALDCWELIIVDNSIDEGLFKTIDLSWHPHARYCREKMIGRVFAIICGMREARAELVLFVDDDTILAPDYIEKGLNKAKEWPMIGVWGGQLFPRFEYPPPDWTKQYWKYIAIEEIEHDKWSNLIHQYETTPPGAGMFVRKCVCLRYIDLTKENPLHLKLGAGGKSLTRCEDSDLAFTACDIGYGTARFKDLVLTHIIPKERLTEDYLVKLMENTVYSTIILESFRGKIPSCKRRTATKNILEAISLIRLPERQRRFYLAEKRGYEKALKEIKTLCQNPDR